MASESSMRKRVIKVLSALDAVPVENSVNPGTPDVNLITGWIELKSLPAWPKRATTTVRFPKFYDQQRFWLRKRHAAGGRTWVLVRINRDWLLFDGKWAADNLGHCDQSTLRRSALAVWNGRLNSEELLDACQ